MVAPSSPDQERLAEVRAALPALGAGIYLDTASAGPLPAETAAAMAAFADWEVTTGRVHAGSWPEAGQRMDEARAAVAAVLTTDPPAVALTHATGDGLRAYAASLPWDRGERAVGTTLDHRDATTALASLRTLGVEVDVVDIGDGADDERSLTVMRAAMTGRTRLVVLPHVTWATGTVLPIAAIVDLAHANGTLVAVDGSHAIGARRIDLAALGADAYAFSARRWLLGPDGMGAIALAADAGSRPDAGRFETSDFDRPSVIGMARSISWLSMYVGLEWAFERTAMLARRAADRLGAIAGVHLLTPSERMAAIVTFAIDGWPAADAQAELGARVFALTRVVAPLDAIRISVGCYTSEDELDRFTDAVALLAAHRPGDLPARRTLAMLDDRP